jgi:hypothetical protein
MAGMRLFGAIFGKFGSNCAPAPMSTGLRASSRPASSRKIGGLKPFGAVRK